MLGNSPYEPFMANFLFVYVSMFRVLIWKFAHGINHSESAANSYSHMTEPDSVQSRAWGRCCIFKSGLPPAKSGKNHNNSRSSLVGRSLRIRIHRIHMFLALLNPDPSIIKQKPWFLLFCDFFSTFYLWKVM
jgi:hypothetical protein